MNIPVAYANKCMACHQTLEEDLDKGVEECEDNMSTAEEQIKEEVYCLQDHLISTSRVEKLSVSASCENNVAPIHTA